MIVCVCKSVSDRTIRAAIEAGAVSFDELQFELGVALCCGKCADSVHGELTACGVATQACEIADKPRLQLAPITFYERKAA
jgi:bacterioferritin-associated ferredoxin